jgi:hypothetical protein
MQGGRLGARDRGAAAQEGQVARVPERGRERERRGGTDKWIQLTGGVATHEWLPGRLVDGD